MMLLLMTTMRSTSKTDKFKPQKIGGFCEVDASALSEEGKYRMELSSW